MASDPTTTPETDEDTGLSGPEAIKEAEIDLTIDDDTGRLYAAVDDLSHWEENPRDADESDIDRVKGHLEELGQFKPLLIISDGTVIGGNQRLRAMRELGTESAWVSLIEPEDEAQLLEYAMADNDRAGHYDERGLGDLLTKYDIDVARFKVDFYKPQDLAQNMAATMDPDDLLEKERAKHDDGDGESTDGDTTATGDSAEADSDATPRSMEHLGSESATSMVQLIMTEAEKGTLSDRVQDLKPVYGVETTSAVVQHAVAEAHETHTDADGEPDTDLSPDDFEETAAEDARTQGAGGDD